MNYLDVFFFHLQNQTIHYCFCRIDDTFHSNKQPLKFPPKKVVSWEGTQQFFLNLTLYLTHLHFRNSKFHSFQFLLYIKNKQTHPATTHFFPSLCIQTGPKTKRGKIHFHGLFTPYQCGNPCHGHILPSNLRLPGL